MPWTIAELAEQLYVDPGNIETVVAIYPDDPEDMWSEEGALPDLMCDALEPVFNPHAERIEPTQYPSTFGEVGWRELHVWKRGRQEIRMLRVSSTPNVSAVVVLRSIAVR